VSLITFSYLCFLIFLGAAGARIYKQKRLPMHLRSEIYPVQHEPGTKVQYGGSYMEEPNWWEKERQTSIWNEIKYMVPEILLLRGLRQNNHHLWRLSFPFHFGLYLVLITLGLLFIGALAMIYGVIISSKAGFWASFLYYLTILLGFAGLTLGTIGAGGLLIRRFRDPELKAYSSLGDYLNLIFLLIFLGVALLTWLIHDRAFAGARAYIYSLLTFGQKSIPYATERTILGWLTIFSGSIILAYIPFTHMSHMFMKFFAYHKIRWEHAPNFKGSKIEQAVLTNLKYNPTWSAPHIDGDGEKTWADIALHLPKEKK